MNKILIFSFLLLSFKSFAIEDTTLVARERNLAIMLDSLRASTNDYDKAQQNKIFKEYLFETLQQKEAYTYPFSKLRTVGFIDSPDGLLRIISWNIEQDDQSQKYYCYIMHKDERKKSVSISELTDNSFMLPPRPDGILEADNWYGALYYKIIPVDKGSKTLYTVLGYDANTSMSNIKLIDVIYFTGDNPKLGSPIFKTPEGTFKRMFYEHSEKTTMSLKYEENYKRIIFDHLSPETPNLKGFYSFYVPDLSLDAFHFTNGKWVLKEDVIGINKEDDEKNGVYVMNEKTHKVEKKEIKNKWENPEDANAPGGGIEHIAVLPEEDVQNSEAQKKALNNKVDKKDKRDPSNMSSVTGGMKKKKRRKS